MSKLIPFEYRSKDGTLQPDNCIVYIDPNTVHILGVCRKTVFDPRGLGDPKSLTGLFISYQNHEYGSVTVTEEQLQASFIAYMDVPVFSDEFDDTYSSITELCGGNPMVYDEIFDSVYS